MKNKKNTIIFVYNINKHIIKNIKKEEFENIICPECKKLTFVDINEENLNIKININCKDKHKKEYSINEFIDSQNIHINDIKCNICNNDKSLYKDNFYICTCNKYICQLCMANHIKNNDKHYLLFYNKQYSFCNKHLIDFVSYCSQCNCNLCQKCEEKHGGHKNQIILYKKEKEKLNYKKKDEMENIIKEKILKMIKFKKEINKINCLYEIYIKELKLELDNNKKFYKILILLLQNLHNYENIKNILNYKYKTINEDYYFSNFLNILNNNPNKDIDNILKDNVENKLKYFLKEINSYIKERINEYTLIYSVEKNNNIIKLFGNKFVKNNKDNCILIIDNEIINLSEYYYIDKENKRTDLKVKLLQKNKVIDMSDMFLGCESLLFLPGISKWNTEDVTNMSGMFFGCSSLSSLPDISKWNTNNVTKMSFMFSGCSFLSSLPDISKWNTINVIDMSFMFNGCFSLTSLPDISKWNTNKVSNMSCMFYDCKSLSSLPDISKWNTNNATNMSFMFSDCKSLTSLPDISKWNINNVTCIYDMFNGCKSSLNVPEKFQKLIQIK